MHTTVRTAALRDVDRILEIEAVSFGRDAWDRPLFLEALDECGDLFFVAKVGRTMSGYAITCVGNRGAELISIAVIPEARRKGVGEALMKATLTGLSRRKAAALRLMVRIENEDAIRFYRGFGFKRVRTVKNYYGAGKHALRMELK